METTDETLDLEKEILSFPLSDLTEGEISGLAFMREEEKLARDVYRVLYSKWNLRVFNNITSSEQRHMDAIKVLINKYSLLDPVVSDETGSFENPELKELYEELILKGEKSIEDALAVGAAIEEIDILDLVEQLSDVVKSEDIAFVYENLKKGSENHLRAFTKNLNRYGIEYQPVYLEKSYYDEIISSSNGRGGY